MRNYLIRLEKVKIDRIPSFTHWGRIDSRTGIDQRAEVGLLSRNVRFYGELGTFSNFHRLIFR